MRPEQLAELEAHTPCKRGCDGGYHCTECESPWPCETAELLAYIRDREARVDALTRALRDARAWNQSLADPWLNLEDIVATALVETEPDGE